MRHILLSIPDNNESHMTVLVGWFEAKGICFCVLSDEQEERAWAAAFPNEALEEGDR